MATQFGGSQRTLSTGDLVISVSEIFDKLQSKVDPDTLEQLLQDIISGHRPQVRPGELITADLFNQIMAELEALDARLTKLEAGGTTTPPAPTPVDITDLLPHGTLHVGDELTIVGKNFVLPAESNTVTVGGFTLNPSAFKLSSNDTHLIFNVPPVALPPSGQTVNVQVTNKNGSDSMPLALMPAFHPPTGRVEVAYAIAPVMPDTPPEAKRIQSGKPYVFTFSVEAFVSADATDVTYEVTPTMAGWNPKLLKDDGSQPADSNQITIPAGISGITRNIRIQVTPPTGTPTADLKIDVVEKSGFNKVTPGSAILTMTVGDFPPTPENRVRISVKSLVPSPATIVGNKAQWKRNTPAALTLVFAFVGGKGQYHAAVDFRQPTGWKAPNGSAPALSPMNFDVQTDGSLASPVRIESILMLQPGAGAADTDLIITINSTSEMSTPVNVKYAQAVGVVD